jgi:DNA-binding Lrp family transcriptional regulator
MMQNRVSFIKFADVKVPVMKEVPSKGWVSFGEDNKFPDMLLTMFNKSSKHNGIVLGKVNYIVGKGFEQKVNANKYEVIDELLKKVTIDIEVFGGCYIEVQYNEIGKIAALYHVPYNKVRSNKDNTQFFIKDWSSYKRNDEPKVFPAYNKNLEPKLLKNQTQIIYYKEYRPGVETYTYPGYMGALNAIQTDIEVSKYHLSTITNGMFASKMISFFEGIPTEEEKREIEKGFKNKFTGSENAGNIVLNFGKDPGKRPQLDDLSSTDLDKHFDVLSKSIQEEIFAGHQVVSPMLFGIRVEGSLGGRSEMRDAYEIFKLTYVSDKQQALEILFSELYGYEMKIIPLEAIGIEFSEGTISQNMTKDEIREKLGLQKIEIEIQSESQVVSDNINALSPLVANKVLEAMTPNEIRGLVGLGPAVGMPSMPGETAVSGQPSVPGATSPEQTMQINDNLKNLTGRQWQNLTRIIRKFEKGDITQEQAKLLLKSSLGLTDEEINVMLSIDNEGMEFSAQEKDELLIAEFEACGEIKDNYVIVKSMPFHFQLDEIDLNLFEKNILILIQRDKRVTSEVISEVLGLSVEEVNAYIERLKSRMIIREVDVRVGEDIVKHRTIVNKILPKVNSEINESEKKPEALNFKILYTYEVKPGLGPAIIDTSRDFCIRMVSLSQTKMWSRADIEAMSRRMGYSVWDRKGGWYGKSKECRHQWVKNIVMLKDKK